MKYGTVSIDDDDDDDDDDGDDDLWKFLGSGKTTNIMLQLSIQCNTI